MTSVFLQQYALAQGARSIVLNFLSSEVGDDLNTPVPVFEGKTIRQLLEHCAYCYYNWLACFAMAKPPLTRPEGADMEYIRRLYSIVDDAVDTFLRTFDGKMESPVTGIHDAMGKLSATPLQVFTHVLTHEFHHKGQIMTMCRLLGHPPPDTDVSNFFT